VLAAFDWVASAFPAAQQKNKTLILRLDAIGDFVVWLPYARALVRHERAKGAEVTMIANSLWASFGSTPPDTKSWWYHSFESGQHIVFFQEKTLSRLAIDSNLFFSSYGGIHNFSRKPFSTVVHRILSGRLSYFLSPVIRRHVGSLTSPDYRKVIDSLRLHRK